MVMVVLCVRRGIKVSIVEESAAFLQTVQAELAGPGTFVSLVVSCLDAPSAHIELQWSMSGLLQSGRWLEVAPHFFSCQSWWRAIWTLGADSYLTVLKHRPSRTFSSCWLLLSAHVVSESW